MIDDLLDELEAHRPKPGPRSHIDRHLQTMPVELADTLRAALADRERFTGGQIARWATGRGFPLSRSQVDEWRRTHV